MSRRLYRAVGDLKGFSLKNCAEAPYPDSVLMCPPDYYEIGEARGPFSTGSGGTLDKALARRQWLKLKSDFEAAGKKVFCVEPAPGFPRMSFCAAQALPGLDSDGAPVCLMGQRRQPLRRKQPPVFESWFRDRGFAVRRLKNPRLYFEGSADAIWHPGKRLLWGGCGFRTDADVYEEAARAFNVPVVLLKLVNSRFYHLDSCFCPLTPESVLIYPAAFDGESLEMILKIFPVVLNASEPEAAKFLACASAVLDSRVAVAPRGAAAVLRHLTVMGLKVIEADVSEFLKSGGGIRRLALFLHERRAGR